MVRLCPEDEAQETGSMCSAMSNYWAALSLAGQNEDRQMLIYTFLMILRELGAEGNLLVA